MNTFKQQFTTWGFRISVGFVLVAATFSALDILVYLPEAESAMQQGALAAMSVAQVVVPYCVMRVFQILRQGQHEEKVLGQLKAQNDNLNHIRHLQVMERS